MSKKSGGKRAQDGDAGGPRIIEGSEAMILLNSKDVVARCMIDAGDDIPTRKKKLAQFLRDMPVQDTALARAQETGDWEELARHLERGGEVTEATRKFLADVLRGKKRENATRPPKETIETRNKNIASMVLLLKESGVKPTAAKQIAADKFNLDFRSIQRASAEWESWVAPVSVAMKALLAAAFGADEATVRASLLASTGVSQDEVRALISPRRRQSGQ
jgi:hypothetical protein